MFQVVLRAPFSLREPVDFDPYTPYTYHFVPTPHGVQFWFGEGVTADIVMQRLVLIYAEARNAVSG